MKDIIEYMLEIMTHEQKVDLWEQLNGGTYSDANLKLWIDYYLEHEFFAKKYKLNLTK